MVLFPHKHTALKWPMPPQPRPRRTATSVMAGDFDPRPRVDVLTSVLNGVKPYRPPLTEEEIREKEEEQAKRRALRQALAEKRANEQREKEEKRKQEEERRLKKGKAVDRDGKSHRANEPSTSAAGVRQHTGERRASSFWQARQPVNTDGTEPTPEPSDAAHSSSRSSSKRPHTPFDSDSGRRSPSMASSNEYVATVSRRRGRDDKKRRLSTNSSIDAEPTVPFSPAKATAPPKKRVAVRKGWKGWIEAEEDELPKDKLIELDQVEVLTDRRTRSGKNFDAIGERQRHMGSCVGKLVSVVGNCRRGASLTFSHRSSEKNGPGGYHA